KRGSQAAFLLSEYRSPRLSVMAALGKEIEDYDAE
ncbi:hypothetical protein M2367_003288, partial [Aeromonas sp. BIGb0445]|nr:hypothetical protein [Aeromonas sp. BIGb0445]